MTTTKSELHLLAAKTDEILANLYYTGAKEKAKIAAAEKRLSPEYRFITDRDRDEAIISAAYEALVDLGIQAAPHEALHHEHRWNRFFLVTGPGGHIHRSLNCSTCYITTDFRWLPALSGLTEAEAVAAHGAILCTVCFPSAPVEWTNHYDEKAKERAAGRCEGSGTWKYDPKTARRGYVYGNAGTCEVCGGRITLTSTGKLRAHKPE